MPRGSICIDLVGKYLRWWWASRIKFVRSAKRGQSPSDHLPAHSQSILDAHMRNPKFTAICIKLFRKLHPRDVPRRL
jgi:hypothetical protein